MRRDIYTRHIENEKRHCWFAARREIIFSLIYNLKNKKNFSILDFGAGSGTNIEILAKLGKVDVFEKNKKMKNFLKLKYKNRKNIKTL